MKKICPILLLLFAFMACTHNHSDNHDHEHDEVKLLITSYNNDFEVYAEADPFVVGKTSDILAHFTHLDTFKPLKAGKVTMSLMVNNRGIRQTVDTPHNPGIYRFQLRPEHSGLARIIFDIEHNGEIYQLDGGSFEVFDDSHTAEHAAQSLLIDHPTAVSFTKEQSWSINFATAPASYRSLGMVIKTVGEILPALSDEVTLSAKTHGIVHFANSELYEGTRLQHGEVLIHISGEGLAEGSVTERYQKSRNNYERARADYERMNNLAEDRIISERELLHAKNELENARVIYENFSENFTESGQLIRSPVQGYLTQLFVSNGQFVEAGQPIAIITQNKEVAIKTEIQQHYASVLSQINTANIISQEGKRYTLEELDGRILSRARNIHSQNHLLSVYLGVNNTTQWITGTLVDVYLKTTQAEARVVVPNTALIEEQGNYFVFVQLHPESFEKREVFPGNTDGLYTEILQGLTQDERIVTQGALLIKIAAASGDIDPHSGHVH